MTQLLTALGGVDPTPNVARIYNFLLGGPHNFPADRTAAERLEQLLPGARQACRDNRDFLIRAVKLAAGSGMTQYLDLGSGLPTEQNVHQVAQEATPAARVVYVDNDPVVCEQSRGLLADGAANVAVVQADLRDPGAVLGDPATRRLLDLSSPLCLVLAAAIQFVPDDAEAAEVMRGFCEAMPPGSWLIYSHGSADYDPAGARRSSDLYTTTSAPAAARPHAAALALLDGWTLLPPGLVWATRWRPDPDADPVPERESMVYAAVAVKP